jgi:hypothetical protein
VNINQAIRHLLRTSPEQWRFDESGLFLTCGNLRLCKQFGSEWVICIDGATEGPLAYAKVSWLTALAIEYFRFGRRTTPTEGDPQ